MLSIHHGDVHYADRMASRPLPVQSGSSASCIELNYVDDGHQAVINAALAARETSEVSMDGHTLEALTSEAPYRPEDSHPGARATGAAVAAGSKSAVCRLSTTSTFECCQKLFNSQTLRWRKRRKGVRDQQENLEAEQRYESCAADDESSPAHACATSSSLPAPAISSLRPRQPLESYRRKPFFSNVTVAVACIMYWAATATLTSAYHSAGETIFGQGTCKATGPSHFEVTCTDGGLFKDSNGKSAYKRCGENEP